MESNIMHKRSNHRPRERGQILIIGVLFMGVLLGLTAMAIDIGILYHQRRDYQNSADAMALAGVAELPLNPALAKTKAEQWGAKNGVDSSEIKKIEVRTTGFPNDTLFVQLEGDFSWIFGRVLGQTTDKVGAQAAARTGTLAGGHSMMPWALLQGDTNCLDSNGHAIFDASCVVKVGASNGITGWLGALDFDGNGGGANEYHDNIIDGTTDWSYCISGQDPPPCHATVDSLTGNKVGPTGQGIDQRLAQGPKCDSNANGVDDFNEVFMPTGHTSPEYTVVCPDSPWLIIIPIVSYESVPVQHVTIRGWSLAYLKGYACYSNGSAANLAEQPVVFAGHSMGTGPASSTAGLSESGGVKVCHHNTSASQESGSAEDSFVLAIEPGEPVPAGLLGPAAPPACHQGTPHGGSTCPTATPTPAPNGTPTPAPTATPTPGPTSTPGPIPSPTPAPAPHANCANGKGHWEVSIEIADAAYSQSAGFLGNYDPTSGILIHRLIE